MKKFLSFFFFILPLQCMAFAPSNSNQITVCAGKQVLGRIEKVMLTDKNLILDAKLDTGAAMSSLSAQNIQIYHRDNTDWVKFTVFLPATNQESSFEVPLIKYIHILKRQEENINSAKATNSDEKEYSIRPVISLTVCVGNEQMPILINLADRSHFLYPMLLGVDALKKLKLLVDVSQNYAASLSCARQPSIPST